MGAIEKPSVKPEDGIAEKKQQPKDGKSKLKFRNYVPKTAELNEFCLVKESTAELEKSIHDEIAEFVEQVGGHAEGQTLDLAPKRPNWDLKRTVAKKTERLTSKTDRAIVELIRMKIKAEKEGEGEKMQVTEEASHALAQQVTQREAEAVSDDEEFI